MKQTEKVSLEARVLNAMTAIWCKCSEQAYRGGAGIFSIQGRRLK